MLDNGTKTWSSDLENKVVVFGDLARPYADGDQVVYKLIQVPQNPDEPGDKPGDGGDNPGGGGDNLAAVIPATGISLAMAAIPATTLATVAITPVMAAIPTEKILIKNRF